MTDITQTVKEDITAPTELYPIASVIPLDPVTVAAFNEAEELAYNTLRNNTVPDMILVAEDMNILSGQVNVIAGEIQTATDTVVAKEALVSPHYDNIDTNADNIDSINTNANNIVDIQNASSNAAIALASANTATSLTNNKGAWSNLAGALAVPAAVNHNNNIYSLNANLADVTLSEPTPTNTDWTVAGRYIPAPTITISTTVNENSITTNGKVNLDDYSGIIFLETLYGTISDINQSDGTFTYTAVDITDGLNKTDEITTYYKLGTMLSETSTPTDMTIVYVPIVADTAYQVVDFTGEASFNDGFDLI